MQSRFRVSVATVMIVLLVASSIVAQSGNSSANVDDLRQKIKRMEAMDLSTMAPSTLEIYKRTLFRLYERSLVSYQQQIDALANIQALADTGDNDAAKARDLLTIERGQIVKKISNLRLSLGVSEDRALTTGNAGAGAEAAELSQPAMNDSSSSLAASAPLSPPPAASPSPSPSPSPAVVCDAKGFPKLVTDEVNRLAGSILVKDDGTLTLKDRAEEISLHNYKLVFYTIADALNVTVTVPLPESEGGAPQTKTISVGELEPYRYLGETVRTDKQLGSSASAASVSAIDKPGFASLLGFGIENGLVERNVRDTVLTLSTSPAALYMLGNVNNGQAYRSAGLLNRVGVSASFNISKQDAPLASVTRSQLREYSVKYRFAGDRSPRSEKLEKIWDGIAEKIQERLKALNNAATFIDTEPVLGPLAEKTNVELQSAVVSLMASSAFKANQDGNKFTPKNVCQVSDTILSYLRTNVSPLGNPNKLSADTITQFKTILVPNLVTAQLNLKIVREEFTKQLDQFFKEPVGTFAYINHREPVTGNYSEFKILYERNTPMLHPLPLKTLTANAGLSFYHRPNPLLKQERMRSVNAALSFEGNANNPFAETLDLSRITYSFVGSYQRMFENSRIAGRKADLGSLQFQMGIPLFKGLAFPFSLTYSNATETDRRRGWRANFGIKMDTDKLLELIRATSPH